MGRAKNFANIYKVNRFYDNYDDLFKDSEVDIIYIASLNNNHYVHSAKAIKHNKAVLCEKPLAINETQVKDLVYLSNERGVFLMEALWTRFNPVFDQLLRWISEGQIGKIKYIYASFSFNGTDRSRDSRLFNLEKGGGSLLDIGIYPLFLSYQLLGYPISIISDSIKSETGVDKQMAMIFSYKDSQALLYSSFSHNEDMQAKICGEKGEIYIDSRWHESKTITLSNNKKIKKKIEFMGKGYFYEIMESNKCIREKRIESNKWTHKNSLELVKLMDTVRAQNNIKYPNE
jgi:predicted dehydrogenase